jgi:hypothetical protein
MDLRERTPWTRNFAESIIRFRSILFLALLIQTYFAFSQSNLYLQNWALAITQQYNLYILAFQNSVTIPLFSIDFVATIIPAIIWIIVRIFWNKGIDGVSSLQYLWGFIFAFPALMAFTGWQNHFQNWILASITLIIMLGIILFTLKKESLMGFLPIVYILAFLGINTTALYTSLPLSQLEFQYTPLTAVFLILTLEAHWFFRLVRKDFWERAHKVGSIIAVLALQIKPLFYAFSTSLLSLIPLFYSQSKENVGLIVLFWVLALIQTIIMSLVLIPTILSLLPFRLRSERALV